MIWGLLILGVGGASFVLWRFLSKRYSLPMPSCLYWMIDVENPFARFARSDFVVSRLGLRPGMAVLDAGCGFWTVDLAYCQSFVSLDKGDRHGPTAWNGG